MDDFVKSKFTRGDKKAIINKFKEVENNSTKKSIERLVEKINTLESTGDKRLKNFYGKKLENSNRKLMQRIGEHYNNTIKNKNKIPRNLALYVAYMHAKKPSMFPIKWKGVERKSPYDAVAEIRKLKYKNTLFKKLQNYKIKKNNQNLNSKNLIEINKILSLLESAKLVKNFNSAENYKKYDYFKNYFKKSSVKNLSKIQSEISTLQNRSKRMGTAAAAVINKNINTLKGKQKIGGAAYKVNKQKKDIVPNLTANQLKSALIRQMGEFNKKKRIINNTNRPPVKKRAEEQLKGIKRYIQNYTNQAKKFSIFNTDENFKKTLGNALKYLSAGG